MDSAYLIDELCGEVARATSREALHLSLLSVSRRMGFDHFALNFDPRSRIGEPGGLLLHDYPAEWAQVYVGFGLAGADPVRRACDKAVMGFAWGGLDAMIPLTRGDRQMLAAGRECGIGDGFTVPRHLPGVASGSCSFVVKPDGTLPRQMLVTAEVVGAVALASAGRIANFLRPPGEPALSDRQRQCLLWAARGKSGSVIGTILGISEETVKQHLKIARDRYEVDSGSRLMVKALYEGLIGFGDLFEWRDPEEDVASQSGPSCGDK